MLFWFLLFPSAHSPLLWHFPEKKSLLSEKNHRKEIKINEYIESIILKHRSTVTGRWGWKERRKHTKKSL
jgi:hypothetical protein